MTVGVAVYLGWLLVNIFLAVIFPFLLFIERTGGPNGIRFLRRFCAWLIRGFFLGYFSLIRVYRIKEIPSIKNLISMGPCIFVANHRSWLDPLLLLAIVPNLQIPVNQAYMRVPLMGTIMRWFGSVPLDRNAKESIIGGVNEVREILKGGAPVAVFPEGTRSEVGQLKQFSDIFFRVAIETSLPLVPIVIHISLPFLGPKSENFLTACRAGLTIRVLEETLPRKGDRGADLRRRVYKQMSSELTRLDSKEAE